MNITKKLCMIFAAIMTAATVWVFLSCGADAMENVSERRSGFFSASDDAFTITVVSGVREKTYEADGKAGELKPYTLVTVAPKEFDVDAIYTFTAKTKKGEFGGTLTVHPFAASFSAEFDSETTGAFTIEIKGGGTAREYSPTSLVTKDMISYRQAIEAAGKALKLPEGQHEVRVRMIENPIGGEGLCWHVAYYYKDGKDYGVLIDPTSAKALAVKK
ncbi:MAG: hypothetical protein J1G38_07480 [Clostridiales bacterium]|nr:hypothetical protein [Clostridiales bacterium]